MSTEENKAIMRRMYDAWNAGDMEALQDFIAPDYVHHRSGTTVQPESGPEFYRQWLTEHSTAFPDHHSKVDDLLADGDKVVSRWTVTGTQRCVESTPLGAIPPSGKKVAVTGTTIARLAGSKIAKEWFEIDILGLLMQIGAIAAPTAS